MIEGHRPKKGAEPVDPDKVVLPGPTAAVNPAAHPDKLGHPTRDVQHGGDRQRLRRVILGSLVDVLNEALTIDPDAIRGLLSSRVACSKEFLAHPSIPVRQDETGACTLSPLGLINGMLGTVEDGPLQGRGWITAEAAEGGVIYRFAVTDPRRHRVNEKEA